MLSQRRFLTSVCDVRGERTGPEATPPADFRKEDRAGSEDPALEEREPRRLRRGGGGKPRRR